MPLPHNLRAPVDPYHPEPVGISDRSGFLFYLSQLPYQFEYRGNSLQNTNLRVGASELDVPFEFNRPIIIGPDPQPPADPRPWHYTQQAQGGVAGPVPIPSDMVSEFIVGESDLGGPDVLGT